MSRRRRLEMRLEHKLSFGTTGSGDPSYRRVAIALSAGLRFVLVAMIRCYQVCIRPFLIGSCKFYPTCSEYAAEAIGTPGARRGLLLTVRRVVRCHPFSHGGIDPVPQAPLQPDEVGIDPQGADGPIVDAEVRVG